MLELTDTTHLTSLSYILPALKHEVIVHLPGAEKATSLLPLDSTHRILEIPPGSHWEPGAHWHEDYIERVRVISGEAKVWVNGKMQRLNAGGETVSQLFHVHNFCRANYDDEPSLLIEEWTDNAKEDGRKIFFFRNAFSLVRDMDRFGGLLWAFLRFFFICSYGDNFIALLPLWTPSWGQRMVTAIVFSMTKTLGRICGWSSWYREYTLDHLRPLAKRTMSSKFCSSIIAVVADEIDKRAVGCF